MFFPKPFVKKTAFLPKYKLSFSQDSDTQTNCSRNSNFFKYPHYAWKTKKSLGGSTRSCGSPQQGISEEASVIEDGFETETYINVLKGMWKDVFEYFNEKNL